MRGTIFIEKIVVSFRHDLSIAVIDVKNVFVLAINLKFNHNLKMYLKANISQVDVNLRCLSFFQIGNSQIADEWMNKDAQSFIESAEVPADTPVRFTLRELLRH